MAHINILSEVTGTVWKIHSSVGDTVQEDAPILILESMKMEIPIASTDKGRIVELLVKEGDSVEDGQIVAAIEV